MTNIGIGQVLLSLVLVNIPILALGNLDASLEIGMQYETNIFYSDDNLESGAASVAKPNINYNKQAKAFYADTKFEAKYHSVSSYSEAARTDYDLEVSTGWGQITKPKIGLNLGATSEANPLFSASSTKAPVMSEQKAGIESHFSFGKKQDIQIDLYSQNQKIDQNDFNYLNNILTEAGFKYFYRFLPETSFYTSVRAGKRLYEEGRRWTDIDSDDTRVKYDSDIAELMFGVSGRLTKYTSIDAGFGYRSMEYTESKSFREPVFHVRFTDQISPKDTIVAGYIYNAVDSTYTNWALEQDMYIGYSRIMRDTFLFLMKLNYVYYSYSEPNRREDQRLLAKFQLDYVFRPKWTIITNFGLDLLVSDAFDTDASSSDRPASYRASSIGFSVKRSF